MTTPSSPSDGQVPFVHRHVDTERYDDIYVIGDVHGCLDELERLLSTLELGDADLGIFVGDLVRKGPESRAVLSRVRDSPRLLSVRGNNEQKLLDGESSITLDDRDREYVASLPVSIGWNGALVVHGGVDPTRPLDAHSEAEVLTTRSPNGDGYDGPFWFETYDGPPRVFFGHTVLSDPLDREWAVGLDTGCVYGGRLTAYHLNRDEFVSVDCDTYVDRSDEKIVDVDALKPRRDDD